MDHKTASVLCGGTRVAVHCSEGALKNAAGSEVYAFEDETWHCVAHINNEIVGCVLLHPQNETKSGKLLQMAVHPDYQGRGIGAQLVRV